MKLKYSILTGLITTLVGFIPLSFNKDKEISYTIYANDIVSANMIKEELINFYKENCFASSFDQIDNKIHSNFYMFKYDYKYENNNVSIFYLNNKIKMTGYLYKQSPSSIKFKSYFTSSAVSIPEATSINVATSALSDQIWYDTPLHVK